MNRLKQIRKQKGFTQKEVAKALHISQSAYSYWESGRTNIDSEALRDLASLFGVSADAILGTDKSWIPIVGDVSAGIPSEAIEYPADDWEQLDESMQNDGHEYFALKIKGDSMSPRMAIGDVVIVRRQPTIENDEIGVFLIDGEATVKKIQITRQGIWLIATNPSYAPRFVNPQDLIVLGKVVELRAKF